MKHFIAVVALALAASESQAQVLVRVGGPFGGGVAVGVGGFRAPFAPMYYHPAMFGQPFAVPMAVPQYFYQPTPAMLPLAAPVQGQPQAASVMMVPQPFYYIGPFGRLRVAY